MTTRNSNRRSLDKKADENAGRHGSQQPSFHQYEIKDPEQLLQSDISEPEFSHLLSLSANFIPDVPYEVIDYKPQHMFNTPSNFPQMPNMKLLQPEFFCRYDVSTLFYIFFYFPGSSQQYFAGRELKQRGWRFHTKYQTWFHRVGEPTEVTKEYEIGKFEYFDHNTSSGWCVRQRNSFKLEYDCLVNE